MGDLIFWTIIRTAISILAIWALKYRIDEQLWWLIAIAITYALIVHPIITGLKKFKIKNEKILSSTICASCKHFDSSALLCMKHDKHPTENYIPCEGIHWEPK